MITCRELTELVTDYLERRLGPIDWLRFQLHLGICRNCRAYLRQMRDTIAVLGRLPSGGIEALSPELEADLLRRFRGWKQGRQ